MQLLAIFVYLNNNIKPLFISSSISVWAGGADLSAYVVNEEGVASADTVPLPGAGGDTGNEVRTLGILTSGVCHMCPYLPYNFDSLMS